jgi:antitoxin (DNA-binding transcriptional repressor) of toxin-antitoxin stability system
MDKEVALREANQQFARYVRAVEAGQSFVITRSRASCRSSRASAC